MHTANAGVRKNFENGSTIGLKVNYQNAFYELPGSLDYDGWKNSRKETTTPDDWARIWSYGAAVDSKIKIGRDQWLYLDGGASHQYRHAVYKSVWGDSNYEYDYYSCRVSPRYVNERDIAGFGNKFTAGLDFRHDRYEEDHISYGAPIVRHFYRDRYAAFIHDEFFFTDDLSLIAGARIERVGNTWRKYVGLKESRSHDWMGDYELGLVYRPVEGVKTYVKGSQFHRSPFCDELSYTQDGCFLEPESGASLDIGFEWEFLDEFFVSANGYGMVMEDEIFFDPALLPWGYNSNSPARTRRIGLDTGFSWLRDKVAEASVKYNVVHADFKSGEYHGNDVPYVPNHRIRLEGGFWIVDDLKIKGGYSFVSRQYVSGDYANSYEKLPAYSLFDMGVYYEPSWAEGWMVSFIMDNIFDRNYCDYAGAGYYYPACGRSFMFTVSYEF
jgi:iron complex outermembrane receptor protein